MSVNSESYNSLVPPAEIKLPKGDGILDSMPDEQHEELLEYLTKRLGEGSAKRPERLIRYSRIDRLISTWQKLNPDDSKREQIEDNTGRNQALPMNLPILASHLEDTVAFYAEVFSSHSRDFYVVPASDQSEGAKNLARQMNQDTKARKYYKELCSGLRALAKYNVGGFAVRYEEGGGLGNLAEPGNRIEAIDMYNYMWDQSVTDVSKIATEAEWAARITLKNKMWVQKGALKGRLQRVNRLLDQHRGKNNYTENKKAKHYRNPPSHVGLTIDGTDNRTSSRTDQTVDWDSYGAGLVGDSGPEIEGYEIAEMYCWLNPAQFGLSDESEAPIEQYELWKFIIIDGCEVCAANRVETIPGAEPEIPHYLGFMTVDDMKEAQRSAMELLRPFQRFASFVMNVYVAGTRKNIWGIKGYDPSVFDVSRLEKGDVAGWLPSKMEGRDVRTGLMTLDSSSGVEKVPEMMNFIMGMIQQLFPSQALPSQIAGIDRAVKNQVAAVLQGVQRRMHMICRIMDSDIMAPMRLQCYRNLALNSSSADFKGLTEESVAKILGSGLNQLNREVVASEIKEIIYAVLQNPESASVFDLIKLFTYWSQLMDSPSDLGDFVKQQSPAVSSSDQTSGANPAPDVLSASGLNGAPASLVPAVA